MLFNIDYFVFKGYASILKPGAEKWVIETHAILKCFTFQAVSHLINIHSLWMVYKLQPVCLLNCIQFRLSEGEI